jgi:hypothetical protein
MLLKSSILCALVLSTSAAHAAPSPLPVEKYSRAIVGKWEIRNTVYAFKKDGTYGMGTSSESNVQEAGRWRISDKTLTLTDPEGHSVAVGISFVSKDQWEWESKPGRTWQAVRVK